MNLPPLTIIGAGSLGSFTALLLAKMGSVFNTPITVIDYDRVETHNTYNQLYRPKDCGLLKTEALHNLINEITGYTISFRNEKITKDSKLEGVVIVLVDTISGRKEIFEALSYQASVPYYIDGRSGGDGAIVYSLNPRDFDAATKYGATLRSEESAIPAPCATESTIHILWQVASVIARILVKITEEPVLRNDFLEIIINNGRLVEIRTNTELL